MIKKKSEKRMSELVETFISTHEKIDHGLQERKIKLFWKSNFGKTINKYTSHIKLRNKTLTVSITSAPLRQELLMSAEKIIKKINKHLENTVIEKIRIV